MSLPEIKTWRTRANTLFHKCLGTFEDSKSYDGDGWMAILDEADKLMDVKETAPVELVARAKAWVDWHDDDAMRDPFPPAPMETLIRDLANAAPASSALREAAAEVAQYDHIDIEQYPNDKKVMERLQAALAAEPEGEGEGEHDRRWYQPDGSYTLMDSAEDVTSRRKWAAGHMEELEVERDALQMISDGVPALREERNDLRTQLSDARADCRKAEAELEEWKSKAAALACDIDRLNRKRSATLEVNTGLLADITSLREKLEETKALASQHMQRATELDAELENERLRLAACAVAAIDNLDDGHPDRLSSDHPSYSASYQGVCSAVDREVEERRKHAEADMVIARLRDELSLLEQSDLKDLEDMRKARDHEQAMRLRSDATMEAATKRAEKAEVSGDAKLRELRAMMSRCLSSRTDEWLPEIDRLLAEPTQSEWDESIKSPEAMESFIAKHPGAKVKPVPSTDAKLRAWIKDRRHRLPRDGSQPYRRIMPGVLQDLEQLLAEPPAEVPIEFTTKVDAAKPADRGDDGPLRAWLEYSKDFDGATPIYMAAINELVRRSLGK